LERLIDLSQAIEADMPIYPGDIRTNLFQTNYLSVNKYNNYRLDISSHAGTHIDSPMHLTESSEYIFDLRLESFIGTGCILDVRNQPIIQMKEEYEELVKDRSIVLLYTGYDKIYGMAEYYQKHPVVDMEFCEFLLSKNIKMLGMDMPSPDMYPFPIHKLLFEKKICIIENLTNLDKLIDVQSFEVIALPLKIKADSSMARVIARVI
jgi:kynurenine formamidase